jgi:acetoacetyl-CoA synthetase
MAPYGCSASHKMNKPIWSPSEVTQKQSVLWRFIEFVNQQNKQSINQYSELYLWSVDNKVAFWSNIWKFFKIISSQPYTEVLTKTEGLPGHQWFKGSRLNFAENLLRYSTELADKPAIVFWGEDKIKREITFQELYEQTAKVAIKLRQFGVVEGDRVAGYLPNIPETVIAMLATSSIGAVWSSCSPDFGVNGVLDRFGQIRPKVLFCADGYYYKGRTVSSIGTVQNITAAIDSINYIIVVPYITSSPSVVMLDNGVLYTDIIDTIQTTTIDFAQLPFNHPLYIMYSSGTTGRPKCIVHSAGGTLIQHLKESALHTNVTQSDRVFYFTTCGWMMWNWLVSNLALGATVVLYDGAPTYPNNDSLFDLIDEEQLTVFGSSAKYLSAIEKSAVKPIETHNLDTLRCILSTGSPLAAESYDYVYRDIKADLQLSSISGGTDIISCFALGNPLLPVYRGELQCIGLGMDVTIRDENGKMLIGSKGELTCAPPFPSMPIYFWDDTDDKKYHSAYFTKFPDVWAQGDYAELTPLGGLIIFGRSDAVLNPGGVRIGTAEIYRQVEKLPEVLESIAVGQQWQNDTRIILFVLLAKNIMLNEDLEANIRQTIYDNTTPRHVPAKILQVTDIPRTISGKIVELAVTQLIHGKTVQNLDALANPAALDQYKNLNELTKD